MTVPSPELSIPPATRPMRLGEHLLAEGLISEAQLERALDAQRLSGYLLGYVVLSLGLLDEDTLTAALAAHLGMPVADLRTESVDPDVARLVPEEFARRHVLLPIRRENGHLAVAMV
ncbi:MAG: GspE/PulE/PilB domain-containing protein, partial [Isosphaeraceae bacterium]